MAKIDRLLRVTFTAFAALAALTFGRACTRSAKFKQIWLCFCLLATLAACGNKENNQPATPEIEIEETSEIETNYFPPSTVTW